MSGCIERCLVTDMAFKERCSFNKVEEQSVAIYEWIMFFTREVLGKGLQWKSWSSFDPGFPPQPLLKYRCNNFG